MWKKTLISLSLAHQNIRARLFHTLLSILGIVIGVAALVTVLSLVDGLEKFAQDQLTQTTTLNAILVESNPYKFSDNIRLKKEDYGVLHYSDIVTLQSALSHPAEVYVSLQIREEIGVDNLEQGIGAAIIAQGVPRAADTSIKFGRYFTHEDVEAGNNVAYVNQFFARKVMGTDSIQGFIDQTFTYRNKQLKVIGILEENEVEFVQVFVPITLLPMEELKENPPRAIIEAYHVEAVPQLKAETENWLKSHFNGDSTDFRVYTNELRVEQAAKGFLLFRVVMGLIVGISVLVGGIGVMNVLLISVNERTVEIGVRKAMGAKRQDILLQFLAESVMVSLFGCFLGLVMGIFGTLIMVPIIKAFVDVPFQAAYTWNTLGVISIIAVVIGIVFGTYPAMQAAKLDPVEAIRRE